MSLKVTVKLSGSLLHNYFGTEEVELSMKPGDDLKNLQDKLLEIAETAEEKDSFFKEHLFIVNSYQVDDTYLLKDGDEVIILPWLIGG